MDRLAEKHMPGAQMNDSKVGTRKIATQLSNIPSRPLLHSRDNLFIFYRNGNAGAGPARLSPQAPDQQHG